MPKLGDNVKDKITGFTGIVTARTEWLYGCIRYIVQPSSLFEGKPIEPVSFDEGQLEVVEAGVHIDNVEKDTGGDRDYVPTRR